MQNRPPARTASRQPTTVKPTTVKPATLKAVAAAAGVHLSTASRALDPAKRHLIAAEVAARIEAEARRLGYRRDAAAASLRTRRSRLVGVLVPDIANPVFSPIISGVSESLSAQGYSTIVADVGSDPKRQAALVDELIARRVDGLILATVRRDDAVLRHCLETRLPVVLVNRADESGRVPAVVSDDLHGMKLAVDHLVALGHRRIGHIAGPAHLSTGHLRRQGFEAAMKAHGLKIPAGGISTAKAYEREAGESAAAALLDIKPRLSAIVAANDLLALGLLRALRARGLTCPGDLSVVGHNDMPLVDMIDPPLTTVRIGPREMGQDAAKLLLSALEGQPGDPAQRVMLRPTLIPRASTAALK
ncbi:MAG: LacI family DNA-binding transcriptional regulator [Ferrovibrio sp.]|nr:LacI family DNA-binding transcriptional regulator [Ferrovibrio sp.]